MAKIITLFVALISLGTLSGCGQKGPLYLPGKVPQKPMTSS